MMRAGLVPAVVLCAAAFGQLPSSVAVDRLPLDTLDVVAPSARVAGAPGAMRVTETGCRAMPAATDAVLRRRIVDVAVQEWAYFGFGVVDQAASGSPGGGALTSGRRGRRRLPAGEAARVAASIAGYWTVTPEGAWVIDEQNAEWNGRAGIGARWQSPWSAAFISWVMCESGLDSADEFRRAVAHHRYIDQAIRARDGAAPGAAYLAYDAGEREVEPGDLLCSGRRPAYRTLAERRRQMGEGARTHCDVVVKVDAARARILAIGGNVRSAVSLKILPARRSADGAVHPWDFSEEQVGPNTYRGARPIFAHLKLRAGPVEPDALDASPTIRALGCSGALTPARRAVLEPVLDAGALGGGSC